MRKVAPRTLTLLMIVSALAVRPAHATEPFAKVGTYAASWLSIPLGPRNIAMGGTGTADASGFGTGYYNPAVASFANATVISGSYLDFGFDIGIYQATLSSPIPFHSDSTASNWRFAGSLGYSLLSMDPQTERTIFLPEGTGRTFDASDWMLTALGATSWSSGVATISGGAAGKYFRSNVAGDHSDIWMLDLGLLVAFPIDLGDGQARPRLGYAVLNLDNGGEHDGRAYTVENQSRFAFGFDISTPTVLVWGKSVPAVSLSLDYDDIERDGRTSDAYAAGFEVSLVEFMHVRYGTIDKGYTSFGVGLGWDWGHTLVRVDYAHQNPGGGVDYVSDDRDTAGVIVGVRW